MAESVEDSLTLNDALKKISGARLVKILSSIQGKKDLVLEQDLMAQLDHIANIRVLREAGVEKVYKLEPRQSPSQSQRCVYVLRPFLSATKLICEHITIDRQKDRDLDYWVVFVPYKLHVCLEMLEQEGVYGHVNILEFPLGFIPLDSDLFSLEIEDFFFSYYLDDDQTWIRAAAGALLQLQKLCKGFSSVNGQGRCAKMVFDMMQKLSEDIEWDGGQAQVDHLVLLDREVDYASTLLTQLTYEGLLDDTFGIKCGRVTFGPEVTQKEPIKINLNSSDLVYQEIRDSHISNVFGFMKQKAQVLQEKFNERHGMDLGRMKNFVSNDLKVLQEQQKSLALHIAACEVIIKQADREFKVHQMTERNLLEAVEIRECLNYVEEAINRQMPVLKCLRLLCLLSITQDGLSSKDYKSLATQFLQSYGHDHLLTVHRLKKLGILTEQTSSNLAGMVASALQKSSFRTVSKRLGLIPKGDSELDASYVFNGTYIPFACKFVELLLQREGGLQKVEDALKLLPGSTIKYARGRQSPGGNSSQKTVLVCFLGGVTFAEIAALRHLSKTKGFKCLVATSSVTSGKRLLQQLTPHNVRS